jgi:hypothetical protein
MHGRIKTVFQLIKNIENEDLKSSPGSILVTPKSGLILDTYLDLKGEFGVELLYTFSSTISHDVFQYRYRGEKPEFVSYDEDLEIDGLANSMSKDHFFRRKKITEKTASILKKIRSGEEISDAEIEFYADEFNSRASQEVGGYPMISSFSQFLGDSPFSRKIFCSVCNREMTFLCSLTSRFNAVIDFIPEYVSVVFHSCAACKCVSAYNTCD